MLQSPQLFTPKKKFLTQYLPFHPKRAILITQKENAQKPNLNGFFKGQLVMNCKIGTYPVEYGDDVQWVPNKFGVQIWIMLTNIRHINVQSIILSLHHLIWIYHQTEISAFNNNLKDWRNLSRVSRYSLFEL